tara:strand:+ start:2390 stop:2605 length:216 start_codon:yes stop_codon:yes gene_type:complete
MVSKSLLLLTSLPFAFYQGRVDNIYLYMKSGSIGKKFITTFTVVGYTNTLKCNRLFEMAYLLGELQGSYTE